MKIYTNNDVQKVNLRDHASAQCHVRIQGGYRRILELLYYGYPLDSGYRRMYRNI